MVAKKQTPVKESTSRAVANWDEQLAAQAAAAAQTEASTATGNFFSLKSGVLTWNDSPMKDNEMAVIIVDGILENVSYDSDYDSDNPQPPICFAFGREADDMVPHEAAVENGTNVHDNCKGCPSNKFGSADKGKGKACRNIRRLAMIPGGSFDKNGKFEAETDVDAIKTAQIGFMKIPVTSITGYAAFVKQVSASIKRPPHGIFTKVKVVPDAKSQFKVTFEALEKVPNSLMAEVMARHEEAVATIESPYKMEREEKPVRGPVSRKGVAPAKKARKY